jgi:hypothetical protein
MTLPRLATQYRALAESGGNRQMQMMLGTKNLSSQTREREAEQLCWKMVWKQEEKDCKLGRDSVTLALQSLILSAPSAWTFSWHLLYVRISFLEYL